MRSIYPRASARVITQRQFHIKKHARAQPRRTIFGGAVNVQQLSAAASHLQRPTQAHRVPCSGCDGEGKRAFENTILLLQHRTAVLGLQLQGTPEASQRTFQQAALGQQQRAVAPGVKQRGVGLQRGVKVSQRGVVLAQPVARVAAVAQHRRPAWRQGQGGAELGFGIGPAAVLGPGQAGEETGLGGFEGGVGGGIGCGHGTRIVRCRRGRAT